MPREYLAGNQDLEERYAQESFMSRASCRLLATSYPSRKRKAPRETRDEGEQALVLPVAIKGAWKNKKSPNPMRSYTPTRAPGLSYLPPLPPPTIGDDRACTRGPARS